VMGVVSAIWACAILFGLSLVFMWARKFIWRWMTPREFRFVAVPTIVLYLYFSQLYMTDQQWSYDRLRNPVTTFIASLFYSHPATPAPHPLTRH